MNYTSLVAAVKARFDRPEAWQQIDTCIALAEATMDRRIARAGLPAPQGRATSTIDAEYGLAPTDLGLIQHMILTATGEEVENITRESMEVIRAADPDRTGKPERFTLMAGQFRYYPIPDEEYTVELTYQKKLAALSSSSLTNWVIDDYPDAYLFGTLDQLADLVGNEPRGKDWRARFDLVMAELIDTERARRGSQATPAYRADIPLGRRYSGYNPNPDI